MIMRPYVVFSWTGCGGFRFYHFHHCEPANCLVLWRLVIRF